MRLFSWLTDCLSLLALVGCATIPACGQAVPMIMYEYSFMSIDPASGLIWAVSETSVMLPYGGWVSAEVDAYAGGGNWSWDDSAADNMSPGHARVQTSAYVDTLGSTYMIWASHMGQMNVWDEPPQFEIAYSFDSRNVPYPPYITLNSIGASNPPYATFNYYVGSLGLYSAYIAVGGSVTYGTATVGEVPMTINQEYISEGASTAYFWGVMYGIPIPGPSCSIQRTNGHSSTQYGGAFIISGGGGNPPGVPVLQWVQHSAAQTADSIQYCLAVDAGKTVKPRLSMGSGSLHGPVQVALSPIYFFETQQFQPGGGVYYMEEIPSTFPLPQGPTLRSRARDLTSSQAWIAPQSQSVICNQICALETGVGLVFGSLGCLTVGLP